MADKDEQLTSFLISTYDRTLLLPNVSVAEIVAHYHPEQSNEKSAPWVIGEILWRKRKIPLISFEILNERGSDVDNKNKRVLVLNGINGHDDLKFYAFEITQVPRTVRVKKDDLSTSDEPLGPAEKMAANLYNEKVVIPDLDFIENEIYNLGLRVELVEDVDQIESQD